MNLITDTATLASFCRELQAEESSGFITLDTEFLRVDTYLPKLCLVQIAGSKRHALIDPLAKGMDLKPLWGVLRDPKLVKVFHSCRQDLEIFYLLSQQIPEPLFDTQVAAMVCGFGDSVGYDALVREYLKIDIDKSLQFTDWSQRPLKPKHLDYALQDVTHLRTVYTHLFDSLQQSGRLSWIQEEMLALKNPQLYEVDLDNIWKRIKTPNSSPRFLARVKELAKFRETEAQRLNKPRTHVFSDKRLLEIATKPMAGLNKKLLEAINRADQLPVNECPTKKSKPIDRKSESKLGLLKILLRYVSAKHGVAQHIIASSQDLQMLAMSNDVTLPALQGWRYEVFGKAATDLKQGRLAISVNNDKVKLVQL